MAAPEIIFKSAAELAPLLKARKLSPVELVRAFLDRIEAVNPKVNAFITVTGEQALEQARRAEREIAGGRYRGPLHGVPYAPKDLFATKGIRTTHGSKVTSDWVPEYESTVTARLNQAGAILVGKLNMLEFAMGSGQVGPGRTGPEPVGPRLFSIGFVERLRRGAGCRHDSSGYWERYGRLHSRSGQELRHCRSEADLWARQPLRRDHAELDAGPCGADGPNGRRRRRECSRRSPVTDPRDDTAAAAPVPDYTKALTGNVKGPAPGRPGRVLFRPGPS